MEDGWKVRMNICTALWSFVNFCCLSQSEVSTDNRKVSTFFAFQHVRCRCCYRSYLDRFLKSMKIGNGHNKVPLSLLYYSFFPHKNHTAAFYTEKIFQVGNFKCPRNWRMLFKSLIYFFFVFQRSYQRRSSSSSFGHQLILLRRKLQNECKMREMQILV